MEAINEALSLIARSIQILEKMNNNVDAYYYYEIDEAISFQKEAIDKLAV